MAKAPALSPTGVLIEERKRVQAILNSPEGRANPSLAQECITQGFSLTQATGVLRAAGKPASSVYLEALEAQAIGITGPAAEAPGQTDPRAARLAAIQATAGDYNARRGYR